FRHAAELQKVLDLAVVSDEKRAELSTHADAQWAWVPRRGARERWPQSGRRGVLGSEGLRKNEMSLMSGQGRTQ
ncbi:MAG: hypothetical protein E5W81_21675, partial [Mesorhizobium sp.]